MGEETLVAAARRALQGVKAPGRAGDIIGQGLVAELSVSPQGVAKAKLLTKDAATLAAAKSALESSPGVARAVVVGEAPANAHADPLGLKTTPRIETDAKDALKGVKKVIAVASGKGGVGKSTIAANLAVALARRGLAVGLLDADIYGPSLPTLFALTEKPEIRDGKIVPADVCGVKAMSIGLLVDAGKALAWRGPMVMGAIRQLLADVEWGALDVLVVDTPPGTGDAHLSLIQSKRLDAAIVVTTPQEMALADARRGVQLFRAAHIRVIGVVENMSYLEIDGRRLTPFGEGGGARVATEADAPLLAMLPLIPELREASDAGAPIAARKPGSAAAKAFDELASKVAAALATN